MTLRRAAPGPQLSAGRVRVDAARAIAKLREYQLADRTAWVLEAIRAAVASGATRIELDGDANDIWLSWEGAPWPVADLPRLFDELVSPEQAAVGDGRDRQHLRLLAAAVNSALGMDPVYVDVYANHDGTGDEHGVRRARYTPDVLDETERPEDSPLRKITAVSAQLPAEVASTAAMAVHLRRRVALGMLTYLFWEREPPELAVARAACRDLAVPLVIRREELHRARAGHDLVRLPLGNDLDGFVALVDPAAPRPAHREATLEVAEHGVVLAVYPLAMSPIGKPVPEGFELRGPLPVRVFLDAKHMPTNASRSQVRREVHPIATAEPRAIALAEKLIADLAGNAMKPDADERTRAVAHALIAAAIAGPGWMMATFANVLGPLADVPLFRDATGTPRPIRHAWDGTVYTAKKPLDSELAQWLSNTLWIPPGDPAQKLVAGSTIDRAATKQRIKQAKALRRAHARFFDHAPRPATLAPQPTTPRLTAALDATLNDTCVSSLELAGLKGEIAIALDRLGGELQLMYRGRPIEHLEHIESLIGFVATIDSESLTPTHEYTAVERDDAFKRVLRAVDCMLVRGAEVIACALNGEAAPPGWSEGPHAPYDVEARAVRTALGLARELALPLRDPLASAKAWCTCDGRWVDLRELWQAKVIGFATGVNQLAPPRGRLMLPGDRLLVAKLCGPNVHFVDYDHPGEDIPRDRRPAVFAAGLAVRHRFALEIRGDDGDLIGALAPTGGASTVHVHHVGRPLESRPYTPAVLFGAVIHVDSDDVVPDVGWRVSAAGGAEVWQRSYADWERALLLAAARTLVGDRPPELHGPEVQGLGNELARALVLAVARPEFQLPAELLARLRATPLVHVLGESHPITIDELAKRFPKAIPYVDKLSTPVEGYAPLVAEAVIAAGIGKLAGIPVQDGSSDLELARRAAKRARALAAHRAKPPLPLAFPAHLGEHVPLVATYLEAKGVVGVASGHMEMEIEIRIEGRPFTTINHAAVAHPHLHPRAARLPLHAIVELDLRYADAEFESVTPLVESQLQDAVAQTAGPLLIAIAKARPEALAELGAPRALLVAYLARNRALPADVRGALHAAPAFVTLLGTRMSIEAASQPRNALRVARWSGDWLPCGDGEAPSPLDEGVLRAPEPNGELEEVLRTLFSGPILDFTDEVTKLQAQRRMARGLLPAPRLLSVPPELKRSLAAFGSIGKELGLGEIGLIPGTSSGVMVHVNGTFKRRVEIDVVPTIDIALESPELGGIAHEAQQLALALVREVLGPTGDAPLPSPIRLTLRRAILAKRIDAELVRAAVFELVDQTWVSVDAVTAQIAKYGNAWTVRDPGPRRPIDPERLVFVLSSVELELARDTYAFIDATYELELDEKVRQNRARPKATSLDLSDQHLLARIELDGDGVTEPRGTLGPLMPYAADQRGFYFHKEMHPFEVFEDPCRWPTIARIDDARLEPDRTWQRPRHPHPVLKEIVAKVSAAAERALARVVPRASGAYTHVTVGPATQLGKLAVASKLAVRGGVSLCAAPRPPQPAIDVIDGFGTHHHVPRHAFGMVGTLYIYAREGYQRGATVDEMLGTLYAMAVKQLIGHRDVPKDLVAAHVANALLLGFITPQDARGTKFACFRPRPLDAHELVALCGTGSPRIVRVVAEHEPDVDPNAEALVEDHSETSRVVIAHLGPRARRTQPEPTLPPPPSAVVSVPATVAIDHADPPTSPTSPTPPTPVPPRQAAPPPAPKPSVQHPIQPLTTVVYGRLFELGLPPFGVRIAEVGSPIVKFTDGVLWFAGDNTRLCAVANAMRAGSPWAPLAIDAVIAHAITVLNQARTEVTDDTEQHVLRSLLVKT